jgi:hypothetical protein
VANTSSLNLTTVQVRLKPHYLAHLHARIIDMYEGPARMLAEAGHIEIVEAEEKHEQKKRKGNR